MKATHNIKLNGRWYAAGEELPEEPKAPAKAPEVKKEAPAEIVPEIPAEPEKTEEPAKEEPKPRNANRRKNGK